MVPSIANFMAGCRPSCVGFIIAERMEQVFIGRDESLLLYRIELRRQHPGLAIFDLQPRSAEIGRSEHFAMSFPPVDRCCPL
jgi:hypothetical protein